MTNLLVVIMTNNQAIKRFYDAIFRDFLTRTEATIVTTTISTSFHPSIKLLVQVFEHQLYQLIPLVLPVSMLSPRTELTTSSTAGLFEEMETLSV